MERTIEPAYCCGYRLRECENCGADRWESLGDRDCGDWDEETFECKECGHRIYVELPA
jgi:rRNA maturation protein Nop10